MRRKRGNDIFVRLVRAERKFGVYGCGGGVGKFLGALTGGLIGKTAETETAKVAQAPMSIEADKGSLQAEEAQRKRLRSQNGFSSTISAGNTSGGGQTQTRTLLGG